MMVFDGQLWRRLMVAKPWLHDTWAEFYTGTPVTNQRDRLGRDFVCGSCKHKRTGW